MINAPFYKFGVFGDEVSLIVAFIIGIGFGFALERAGFGNARKLAAQFYFRDLAVLKVMFTAIITALVGLFFLSSIGWVDLSLVYLTPTFLVPQIVGGLILGIGFVIGGYCPGTSVVSAGTGRIDGMIYLVGVCIGLVVYGEIYPLIEDWTHSTSMGKVTLPGYFNISYGFMVFAVVLMAVGAFIAAEIAELKIGGREPDKSSLTTTANKVNSTRILMAFLLVMGFVAIFVGNPYRGSKALIDTKELAMIVGNKTDHVEATDLAERIIQGNINFTLIDLRDESEYNTYHIPTAINMEMAAIDFDVLPRNETIILYSGGGIHSAQAWFFFKARGYSSVYMIFDGLNAWMDEVLYPGKPEELEADALAEFEKRAEIAKFFGGKPRDTGSETESMEAPVLPDVPMPLTIPIQSTTGRKKREGC